LKLKNPNPLDVLKIRRVKFCPPHFSTTQIARSYNLDKVICEWIIDNLSGRYYFGSTIKLDEDKNFTQMYQVGFESAKELSFFMLACPHLKYN